MSGMDGCAPVLQNSSGMCLLKIIKLTEPAKLVTHSKRATF